MNLSQMEAVIEALLFLSGQAVPLTQIAATLSLDKATTKAIVQSMMTKFEQQSRGVRITKLEDCYQMCTAPECYEYLKKAYEPEKKQGLSQSLMETLAIIAYKQPVTKAQIEDIRGVNADHAVNKLMEKNLVKEIGRAEVPGRPILLGTSEEFLRYFGFSSLDELPEIQSEDGGLDANL